MPEFRICCKDLNEAFEKVPNSMFRVEENGVLYLTVGCVQTERGPGFFDQAVIFCPFCGVRLQNPAEIQRKPVPSRQPTAAD